MIKKNELGTGTYGKVYRAQDLNRNKIVAIKRNFKHTTVSWIGNLREINFLKTLERHPFIIHLIDVAMGDPFYGKQFTPKKKSDDTKDDNMHFVLEYVPETLFTFVEHREFNLTVAKKICVQILLAAEYMHSYDISHRDIKPNNILISHNNLENIEIKLIDFGMAQNMCPHCPTTPNVLTSWYRPWEVCILHPAYTTKIDMWPIGCVFFELFGVDPFISFDEANTNHKTSNITINKIIKHHPLVPPKKHITDCCKYLPKRSPKFDIPNYEEIVKMKRTPFIEKMKMKKTLKNSMNEEDLNQLEDLLLKLICIDMDERISASGALRHPFFECEKQYISDIRKQHKLEYLPLVEIISSTERNYAMELAKNIYLHRNNIDWYSHKILFHAIEIFDRYLEYKKNNNEVEENKKTIEFKFYVCAYAYYKVQLCMEIPISWKLFTGEDYVKKNIEGEEFEYFLSKHVLNYILYRKTVFEFLESKNEVEFILNKLCDPKLSYNGGSYRKLYRILSEKE